MSWILTIAGFAALIVLHELGHFIAAKATGMRVERFFLFFPPKLVSVRRGETEYGIGAIPAGGFVKITGMSPEEDLPPDVAERGYYRQPVWKRIVVIAAGPAMNLVLAFALLFVLAFGAERTTSAVGTIEAGSPAAAHLEPGDRIVAVDGHRFPELNGEQRLIHFGRLVATHDCAGKPTDGCRATTPARLRVRRGGETRKITVFPRYDADARRTRLGFAYGTAPTNPPAGEAASTALDSMWRVTSGTVGVIGRIFESEQRKKIHGIVGISDVTHQAFEFGAREALTLLALVSLSLAVINLFPFLPLDGGHIFWSVVEKLRGRPVSFQAMERASIVGFALVLMLFVIGFSNDIDRLTNGGFNLR